MKSDEPFDDVRPYYVGTNCPKCGENRVTNRIHNHTSFVCGYSAYKNCEGAKYRHRLVIPEPQEP